MATTRYSGRVVVRSAGVLLAIAIALASCTTGVDRSGADDPLAVHLEQALEIAHEEWDASWMLDLASARYEPDDDGLVRKDIAYVFVSGDVSYYLVRFHADGSVSSGPVAGIARFPIEAFDFADNEMTSDEALERAWESFGETLVERCGPLRWLDVVGSIGSEGGQVWSVSYRVGGQEHTVWIDAASGTVIEIDEEPC